MTSVVIPKTYGRMGNFLFQAAAAMAYAWRHEIGYSLPCRTEDPKWNPIYLQHLVKPGPLPAEVIAIEERTHRFQGLAFHPDWKRDRLIILDGYWQSEKYFKGYRSQILHEFGFPWEFTKETVSVHVRRGDYLTIQKGGKFKHPPVSKEWILAQMAKFPGATFVFFSDDLEWCCQEFQRDDCEMGLDWDGPLPDDRQEVKDLISMSCCEHHICSASTFSWWGAWLNQNPNKRVIMPKHWLTPGWGPDCSDIVPPEWERA